MYKIIRTLSTPKATSLSLATCLRSLISRLHRLSSVRELIGCPKTRLNQADHVNFTGDSLAAREAPVTEFAPFNITAAADDQSKSSLEDHILKLTKFCNESGSNGTAVGWGMNRYSSKLDSRANSIQSSKTRTILTRLKERRNFCRLSSAGRASKRIC